ncbi:MAG: hypothetical protein U0U46_18395 [Saprospiraceae bacterium]
MVQQRRQQPDGFSNTTYSVTVTDGNNCSGSDTHSVSVNANPAPAITGPTSVCSGGNVFDAGSGYSITGAWSNSGGSSQTATFSGITSDLHRHRWQQLLRLHPKCQPGLITGPTSVCGGNVTPTQAAGTSPTHGPTAGGSSQTATFSNIRPTRLTRHRHRWQQLGSDTQSVSVPTRPTITGPTRSGGNVTLDAGSGYSTYAWSNSWGGSSQTATYSNITSNTTYRHRHRWQQLLRLRYP